MSFCIKGGKILLSELSKWGQKVTEDILSSIFIVTEYTCFSHSLWNWRFFFLPQLFCRKEIPAATSSPVSWPASSPEAVSQVYTWEIHWFKCLRTNITIRKPLLCSSIYAQACCMWMLDTWEQISHLRSLLLKSVVTFSRHPLHLWWKTGTIRAIKSVLFGLLSLCCLVAAVTQAVFPVALPCFLQSCCAVQAKGGCQVGPVGGWPQILFVPAAGWDSLAVPGKLRLCPEMAALPL